MRRAVRGALILALLGWMTACSTLLGPEATPVPGAAATLTRSINTPIPTPVHTPAASPAASPARVAAAASPSSVAAGSPQGLSGDDAAQLQNEMELVLSSAGLSGIEQLLLDHVSLSTSAGGNVMSGADAAAWLRDHAGPGIMVTQVQRGTQEVMLVVSTEGWPKKDPIEQGNVNFSLRRYDASGRQDESGGGDWKIDVIEAE
jgi:hypothetical protein